MSWRIIERNRTDDAQLAVWMSATNSRWGMITSAQKFAVVELHRHKIGERDYPYLLMSDFTSLYSPTVSAVQIMLYMVLTATETPEPGWIPSGTGFPLSDPHSHYNEMPGSTRSQSRALTEGQSDAASSPGGSSKLGSIAEEGTEEPETGSCIRFPTHDPYLAWMEENLRSRVKGSPYDPTGGTVRPW